MKVKEIKEIYDNLTGEDKEFDADKFAEKVSEKSNKFINDNVAKEKVDKEQIVEEFLKENNFEGKKQFEDWKKEQSQKVEELEGKLNEYDEKVKDYDSKLSNAEKEKMLYSEGVKDAKRQTLLKTLYEQREDEKMEFGDFVKQELENDPSLYKKTQTETAVKTKGTPESENVPEWERRLNEKHNLDK